MSLLLNQHLFDKELLVLKKIVSLANRAVSKIGHILHNTVLLNNIGNDGIELVLYRLDVFVVLPNH